MQELKSLTPEQHALARDLAMHAREKCARNIQDAVGLIDPSDPYAAVIVAATITNILQYMMADGAASIAALSVEGNEAIGHDDTGAAFIAAKPKFVALTNLTAIEICKHIIKVAEQYNVEHS